MEKSYKPNELGQGTDLEAAVGPGSAVTARLISAERQIGP